MRVNSVRVDERNSNICNPESRSTWLRRLRGYMCGSIWHAQEGDGGGVTFAGSFNFFFSTYIISFDWITLFNYYHYTVFVIQYNSGKVYKKYKKNVLTKMRKRIWKKVQYVFIKKRSKNECKTGVVSPLIGQLRFIYSTRITKSV